MTNRRIKKMSTITTHLNGEELIAWKGFKTNENEVIIMDEDAKFGNFEEFRVVIEPSLLKFWIEECGLLDKLDIDKAEIY